jgi:hypothetical protein
MMDMTNRIACWVGAAVSIILAAACLNTIGMRPDWRTEIALVIFFLNGLVICWLQFP